MLVLLVLLCLMSVSLEMTVGRCEAPMRPGHTDCEMPRDGVRWFYDNELDDCFEYFYYGCGAGPNSFTDYYACRRYCTAADRFNCAGNTEPTASCSRRYNTCPRGSTCIIGFVTGRCCDIEEEEQWYKETHPTCKQGRPLTRKTDYGEAIRFGRSCSHKFCPLGYQCIQGKRLAYCCKEELENW
ncbi:Kunitz/Bovine pancreatic trypsin inhibitor domain protein [Oesophagostomum dentatum]|uniref:Kunitz/Bovine pancreatic trypsin inhibitor domain protein n=1 Tax=Oesophagostomum dentatum TaxID=61180 RepID=A0A0B1T487_OESDE|nr:Kunitz/Bovine pancreatic trypsin inhibitor domain protein [Oesophagostomum dentatum]